MSASRTSDSRFSTTAKIAHGGMATIHAGSMRTADGQAKRVAIKVLHPHLAEDAHVRRMFLHEARLAERLAHENVVRVLDHGEDEELGTFIVMEYVEGADLAAVLKSAARTEVSVPPRVVVRVVLDFLEGLHAAHELCSEDGHPLNLIHRDVSPHNVLVGTDGRARLTDFGIAKSDERYTMTRPGQLKGKLSYMAPEQLAHEDELDRRVDVFAAGVVLWEALTARRLFKGEDELSIINKVLLSKVPAPSSVTPELAPFDEVLAKALAREPDERWPSARAMADALEAASRSIGGPASRDEVSAALTEQAGDQIAELAARIERGSVTPSEIGLRSGPAVGKEDLTLDAPPAPRAARWPWLGLLVLLVGVLGAGGWLATRPHDAAREPGVAAAEERMIGAPEPATESPTTVTIESRDEPTAAPIADAGIARAAVGPAPRRPVARSTPLRRGARAPEAAPAPGPDEDERSAPTAPAPADDLIPNPYGD